MNKICILSIGALLTAGAAAQNVDMSLYSGSASDRGITLTPWGGGAISESSEVALAGTNSLRVETSNFFQGGIVRWATPVDLASLTAVKENLLAFGVYVVDRAGTPGAQPPAGGGAGVVGGGPTTGGDAGGGRGGGVVGAGGGRGGGVVGAGGGGEVGGGAASPGASTRVAKRMERMRVIIQTSDGKLSEAIIPIGQAGVAGNRWVRVGIPLKSISGFENTNRQIVSIAAAGDAPTNFYIGEIRVVNDQTPIQGYIPRTEYNIAFSTELMFTASAEAGLSVLEYVWDFNAADGVHDDAIGQAVYHRFRLPGEYTVTLTIRDIHGLKEPWRGTVKVTVNP